jgi:hypothetical protein
MNRRSEILTAGAASIETYVDGHGPAVVIIPSYGRDGGEDFDSSAQRSSTPAIGCCGPNLAALPARWVR